MLSISRTVTAVLAVSLVGSLPAMAQVNGETGARDFIVRQAEIDRAAESAESGQDATPVAKADDAKDAKLKDAKAKDAAAKTAAAAKAAKAKGPDGKDTRAKVATAVEKASPGFSAVERAKAAFKRSLTATSQIDPIGSRGAPVAAVPVTAPKPAVAAAPVVRPEPAPAAAVAAPAVGGDGLKALVARHAAANGVPFALADAIVRIESRYNPRAAHAGNYGLMQIRHQTARGMGYTGGAGGLLDPETNARYAMKYLAMAYRMAGGDTCRTVMKYQSGHMSERMSGANRTYCAKVRTITASN